MQNLERKLVDATCRNNFGAFFYRVFPVLNPGQFLEENWHIDAICFRLEGVVQGTVEPHLVINLPPRTLKSSIASCALPAWILGRNPSARIICASYSEELAFKLSRDSRTILESSVYKRLFPRTRLNPRKSTEREFETTAGGFRLATSVGGTLTGRGGEFLIIDDPMKANDGNSEPALNNVAEWFRSTAFSRLDNQAIGRIIIAMQRLHVKDLSGILIDQGWPSLVMPAIAPEPAVYRVADGESHHRHAGDLLQPTRDDRAAFDRIRQHIGSHLFSAQYQQDPLPAEGNMIRAAWLVRYDSPPVKQGSERIVLACDPAGKPGEHNDYTAIVICGVEDRRTRLLNATRGHWTMLEMASQITRLAFEWKVDLTIIEDTSTGMGLIQLLRDYPRLNLVSFHPVGAKEERMQSHLGQFEAGRILLPKEAPWLADFEKELFAFPAGRYDDQVDALLLVLDRFSQPWRTVPRVELGLPIFR